MREKRPTTMNIFLIVSAEANLLFQALLERRVIRMKIIMEVTSKKVVTFERAESPKNIPKMIKKCFNG